MAAHCPKGLVDLPMFLAFCVCVYFFSFLGNLFVLKQNAPYDVLIRWRRKYGGVFTYWYGEMPVVNVVDYALIQETFVRDGDAYADRVKFPAVTRMYRGLCLMM